MNGAIVLVKMLKAYQTQVIFGVPGDTSIPFYEALHDTGTEINHVMARDERSAGFMADAYARISHKPGICECPSGAGPLYSLPGVAEANASSIPLILITSDIPLAGEGKKTITELNTQKLFEPVTKWSTVLNDVNRIPEIMRRAFRIAVSGRPGAVHLAFPQEVMTQAFTGDEEMIFGETECRTYPAFRTRGSRRVLEEAVRHIGAARRPVLIAGGGAKHSQAEAEIQQLAERIQCPVVTTISGQGILSDEHPLAMGVTGDNGYHPHAHRAIREGDLLIYVGCKMGSVSTLKWTLPAPAKDLKIIQIDLDPELLGNNYINTISIAGDARLVLRDMIALVAEGFAAATPAPAPGPWLADLNRHRRQFWADSRALLGADTLPIKPQRVIAEINHRIHAPTIVVADAGTPTPHITRFLKLAQPQSNFIIPRSFGGLGYAIPALTGVHFARPGARLIGLFGDGSLGMSAGELETLARLSIPAILIHFNNACFGWIKALQALHAKKKFYSVDFTPGDPGLVAQGFGIPAIRIRTIQELTTGLDQAFSTQGPVLLDIMAETEVSELPPVHSWERAADKHPLNESKEEMI